LATALLLGGASFTTGAFIAAGQPETVVRDYFAALQRGDAAAALGYGARPTGSTTMLTSTFLAKQNAAGPIQALAVNRVRREGDRAQVDVTYTLGLSAHPTRVDDTVAVVRSGHGWRLTRTTVTEQVAAGGGSDLARFAGFAVPDGEYPMFPGAVPVTYSTPNLMLAPTHRVVTFNDGGLLLVDATVSPAGRAALTDAITGGLRACLNGDSRTQYLCPEPDSGVAVPGSLRGRLTGPVGKALDYQLAGTGAEITVTGDVPVAASYRRLDVNDVPSTVTTKTDTVEAHAYATKPNAYWWVSE
jgi:hypothetical protein